MYRSSSTCDLRRIQPMLDFKTASIIVTSIVHSKLDYCYSLFLNLDSTQIQRLQLIQNSLARAVTRTSRHHDITPVLKSIHWLKIPERIHFKVLSLTYNSLQPSKLTYLRQLFTIRGVAVVEWLRSRPLDCEVRGSNHDQGRHLKTKISASGAHQRWWRRVTRAG